jgi:hypothetical protein
VLDGDLDQFMAATLAQKAFGGAPERVEEVESGARRSKHSVMAGQ